jgi:decaprenylphospho-beta-D-erythro-pentofuranosid-2-ulose 2-reductase
MNKNVLILGGNSDIAKACAKLYTTKGFTITLASRNTTELKNFCNQNKIEAEVLPFDALAYHTHQLFYDSLPQKPLIVICAFGYLVENDKSIQNFNEAEQVIDTNFKGAVSILNIISKDFQEKGEGTIIGISSVAADRGRASNLIYGAAKAGFDAYLSGLRNLMHPFGVNVITIKPGFVATKMIANHPTPAILTASADETAVKIYSAYKNKRNIVYSNLKWRLIMLIIQSIPERIFKKLKL